MSYDRLLYTAARDVVAIHRAILRAGTIREIHQLASAFAQSLRMLDTASRLAHDRTRTRAFRASRPADG